VKGKSSPCIFLNKEEKDKKKSFLYHLAGGEKPMCWQISKHREALANPTVLHLPVLFLLWLFTDRFMVLVHQKMSYGCCTAFFKGFIHLVQQLCFTLVVS